MWCLQPRPTRGSIAPQVFLVKEWRDTATDVGDQQSLVASLRQSPYFGMFQDHIEGWEKRLGILQDALGSMAAVQRKWLYLEPIFARGALPEQAPRFRQVFLICPSRPFSLPATRLDAVKQLS